MTVSIARNSPRERINWPRLLGRAQNIILVFIAALFLYVHGTAIAGGRWASVPFAAEQVVLVALFLARRRSLATSGRPFDWTVAAIGTWLPLVYRPIGGPEQLGEIGFAMQLAGISLATVCFVALGRSFGIVAANRGLKTQGPYRLIRHPIYAAHIITGSGFLMANPSALNLGLWSIVFVAHLLRIGAEERVLTESGPYAQYRAKVRWRLVPGLY